MSMLAIAISIAILIIVTSVMNGFREELLSKILGFNAHITVSKHEEFKNFNELKDEIALKKKYLFKRIKKYKSNKKIFMIINNFIQKGNIVGYSSNMNIYEDLLKEYKKERLKYKSQNVGKRIYQMTEIAKLVGSINDNDNSCIIF